MIEFCCREIVPTVSRAAERIEQVELLNDFPVDNVLMSKQCIVRVDTYIIRVAKVWLWIVERQSRVVAGRL